MKVNVELHAPVGLPPGKNSCYSLNRNSGGEGGGVLILPEDELLPSSPLHICTEYAIQGQVYG